jgi:hypothetical protein
MFKGTRSILACRLILSLRWILQFRVHVASKIMGREKN